VIDKKMEIKSSNLVVKDNLRDRKTGQALVAKAKDSEVDSGHITGAKMDKGNEEEECTNEED
jgi:hypothetical protein